MTCQIALRTYCAFTTFSLCSSRWYKFKFTLSTFSFVLQVFLSELCFQKIGREDIKARKKGSSSKPGPGVGDGKGTRKPRAQPTRSRLSPVPSPSYGPQQHKGSLCLKQSMVALIQSTLQENIIILCVHDKS